MCSHADAAAGSGSDADSAGSAAPAALSSGFEEEWRVISVRYPSTMLHHEGKRINLYELVCGNFVGVRGRKLDAIRSKLGRHGYHLRVNHQMVDADEAHTYVAIQVSVLGVVMDQAVTHLLDSFTAAAHAVLVVHPRAGDVHVSAPLGGAQLHLRVSPRGVASAAPQQEQPPAPARREAEGGARRSAQAAVVAAANGSQCASGPGGGRVSVQQSPSWGAAGLQAVVGPAGADCAGESRLGSDSAQPIQLRSEGSTSSSAISSAAASAAAGACPTPKQRFMQQAAAAAAAMAGDASGGALTAQMPTMVRRTSTAGSGGTSHCSTQVAELPARAHAAAAARAAGARSSAGGGRDECLEQLLIGSELLSLLS